jgi:hypothetical protein
MNSAPPNHALKGSTLTHAFCTSCIHAESWCHLEIGPAEVFQCAARWNNGVEKRPQRDTITKQTNISACMVIDAF